MDMAFADVMEVFVTPITVLIGLLGNALSICVLRKKEIQLRGSFARILIALAVFDITFIAASGGMFSLRALSDYYRMHIYPYTVPILLPLAQISMTASVYTTVVTCFDRYIAICRPALLGCCGRSEEKTSWSLIIGTAIFSVFYNISRFFEYRVMWVTTTYTNFDNFTNESLLANVTELAVVPTELRENVNYIQYYILLTNFIFMGICPIIVMITFNVLVVRAVEAANQRRARMTKRQQRNITVTSMLVSVVLVFLICHSVKLIINCYEVYQLISMSGSSPSSSPSGNELSKENQAHSRGGAGGGGGGGEVSYLEPLNKMENDTLYMDDEIDDGSQTWPLWADYMTIISHWLLILNSSCNIAIYLHKDPKFKAVLKDMMLNLFKIPHISLAACEEEESRTGAVRLQVFRQGEQNQAMVELEGFDDDDDDDDDDDGDEEESFPTKADSFDKGNHSPGNGQVRTASTGTMTKNQCQILITTHT